MITVVVGGAAECRLVGRLLADLMDPCAIFLLSERSADAARPLAQAIVIKEPQPVAFVINADSTIKIA